MASINEWTQVYMSGVLPQQWNNNLKGIVEALNDGKRSPQQIYSILMGMGIPSEKALLGINNYITPKGNAKLGFIDINKNNQYIMENFDHKILAEKIQTLIEKLSTMAEDNATKLNYSAQLSSEIAKRYLDQVNNVIIKLDEIKNNNELSEKVKSRTNRSDLTGRSEFFYAVRMIKELNSHDWIKPVLEFTSEMKAILKTNKYTAMLSETIRDLSSLKNRDFYENVISDLEFLIEKSEEDIKKDFKAILTKHSWIHSIQNMMSIYGVEESKLISNSEGKVSKVYSPVVVNEAKELIFALDGNYLKLSEGKIIKATRDDIDGRFLNAEKALKNFKVIDEKFVLYHGKNVLSIDTNNDEIKVNTQIVEEKSLKNYLLRCSFFTLNEMYMLDEVMFLMESIDDIKELDFVTSVTSMANPKIKVNLIKVDENIYLNRINPFSGTNDIVTANNAENAQDLMNEYVKYDISNSVSDLLEQEKLEKLELTNEKNSIIDKIKFLEEKKTEIQNTISMTGNDDTLLKALEIMESELRDRELELQNVYSKLGENLSENKKLEDEGYISGSVKKNSGSFKKGDKIWVYAEDYTSKGDKDSIKIKDKDGKKDGSLKKVDIKVNL